MILPVIPDFSGSSLKLPNTACSSKSIEPIQRSARRPLRYFENVSVLLAMILRSYAGLPAEAMMNSYVIVLVR